MRLLGALPPGGRGGERNWPEVSRSETPEMAAWEWAVSDTGMEEWQYQIWEWENGSIRHGNGRMAVSDVGIAS